MSRDLDKRVAEALGYSDPITLYRWQDRKERKRSVVMFRVAPKSTYQSFDSFVDVDGKKYNYQSLSLFDFPYYSTDIAAAIGALEEYCKEPKRYWQIFKATGYLCEIWTAVDHGMPEVCSGREKNTIPLAICAAILSATDAGVRE